MGRQTARALHHERRESGNPHESEGALTAMMSKLGFDLEERLGVGQFTRREKEVDEMGQIKSAQRCVLYTVQESKQEMRSKGIQLS